MQNVLEDTAFICRHYKEEIHLETSVQALWFQLNVRHLWWRVGFGARFCQSLAAAQAEGIRHRNAPPA